VKLTLVDEEPVLLEPFRVESVYPHVVLTFTLSGQSLLPEAKGYPYGRTRVEKLAFEAGS
jgi:hypothetical protein